MALHCEKYKNIALNKKKKIKNNNKIKLNKLFFIH